MAQTGFTPIQLYSTSTAAAAPGASNLTNSTLGSELAINITDGKLFYKDNANAVQVIGWKVRPANAGGTGITSYAIGDILYADTTSTLAKLPDVATGNALISGGVGVAPSYGKIGLTTHVSGILPVANGGTGTATAFTAGSVVFAGASGVYSEDNASLFYDNTNDRLGVGTIAPSGKLHVAGAMPAIAGGNGQLQVFSTDALAADKGGKISLGGVSGQGGAFDPYGFCYVAGLKENATASNFAGYLSFGTSNSGGSLSERQRIDSAGIVTMGAYGAGAATFSAAGVISSVSDETWKIKDGVPVDPDSMLKKLSPGYWYYNDEKKKTFGVDRQLGFYAQNVNAAIGPEAAPQPEVTITKDIDGKDISTSKPWGYYDRSVLAITVMSLQKALATIESLTARIETLETK